MKNKRLLTGVMALLITICSGGVRAQESTVSGQVLDGEDESTIPGVNVTIKGTSKGTITDLDGKFTITVAKGETLVFSFVGYNTEEVAIGTQSNINVSLIPDIKTLSEVVVVGYGTQLRKDLTGTISTVKGSTISETPTSSFDAALQGRVPGLQVTQSSGVPGSAVRVRLRGQNSISGNSQPLYVVDGIPVIQSDFSKRDGPASGVNANPMADINPNDIESVEVLKDAAAAAIYGSRGANGVILITTKRGKEGKTSFSASYSTGITEATNKIDFLNAAEWLTLYGEAYKNANGTALAGDHVIARGITPQDIIEQGTNADWVDEVLRQGSLQEASVSARGGNEKTRFYIGGAYRDEEGFLKGNDFSRISGRINVDNKATDKLTMGTQISLSRTERNQPRTGDGGTFGKAQSDALPIFPVYNPDGSFFGSTPLQSNKAADEAPDPAGINPVAQLADRFNTKGLRALANLYLTYTIIDNLEFKNEFGFDYYNQFEEIIVSPVNRYIRPQDYTDPDNIVNLPVVQAGSFEERNLNAFNFNYNSTLNYTKSINENNSLSALLGFSVQKSSERFSGNFTQGNAGFVDEFYTNTDGGLINFDLNPNPVPPVMGGYNDGLDNTFSFLSYFTRINYKLKDRYLFGLSFRADGSSRFGANNRYGYFPALSLGWVLSDESFYKGAFSDKVNFLKVRTSFGIVGNAEIGNFQWLAAYGLSDNYLGRTGFAARRFANPDLSWESTRKFDIGIDYELREGRFSGTLGLYNNRSTDLLLNQSIQASTGFVNIFANTDIIVRNRGFEFNITSKNLVSENGLQWTTDINVSRNENKVLDDGGLPPDAFDVDFGEGRIVEGYPIGITFITRSAGVDPADGRERFYTAEGTETFKASVENPDERVPLGNPFPNFVGGMTNTLSYKNFDLSFVVTFSEGNTVFDDAAKFQIGDLSANPKAQRREVLNRWQSPENPGNGSVPALFTSGPGSGRALNSDRFLYDASFIRLRTATLSYRLPPSITDRMHLSNAKVYVTGQNLLLFTKFPGWDPEFSRQAGGTSFFTNTFSQFAQSNISASVAGNGALPQTRSITAGINIGF